jgi:hypothetical protein
LHVAELIEPAPGDRAVELGLFFAGRQSAASDDWCWQIAPAPERLVDPHELAQRLDVLVVELHDLGEHRDERGVALDAIAVDRGDLAQHPRRPGLSSAGVRSRSCRSSSMSAFHPSVCV